MRGDIVIVRAYRNKPLVRRVWETDNQLIFLVNEAEFRSLMDGHEKPVGLIGFPKEDVFKYDPNLAEEVEKGFRDGCFLWDRLKPFIELRHEEK
jgi:hypothetical protein